jgi:hypothetical protein
MAESEKGFLVGDVTLIPMLGDISVGARHRTRTSRHKILFLWREKDVQCTEIR